MLSNPIEGAPKFL